MPTAPARVWALVVAGLIAVGASPILIRLAGDAPALALAAGRTITVTVLMVPLALVQARDELAAFEGRDWALALGAGVLLGLHFMSWIVSVQLTSVASASVLVTMSPIFIAVLGAVFLSERPSRRTAAAIGVAVVGATMIGLSEGTSVEAYPNPPLGNSLALLAAVLVSVYLLIGRAVRRKTSFLAYFAPLNAAAAATCVAGCLVAGVPLALPLEAAVLAVLMGLGPGLLGHGSFAYALKYLPAALIGLLSLAEPVIASTVALVAFQEIPSATGVIGMVVVLAAIAAVVTAGEERASRPDPVA